MPITPSEAKKKRDIPDIDPAVLAAEVKRIDEYLCESPAPDKRWYYDIRHINRDVANQLAVDYRKAGWEVEITTDRDGTSLVFEEPRWRGRAEPDKHGM